MQFWTKTWRVNYEVSWDDGTSFACNVAEVELEEEDDKKHKVVWICPFGQCACCNSLVEEEAPALVPQVKQET